MPSAEPKVVVYEARNLVNGHRYIGYTARGLKQRERQHRNTASTRGDYGHRLHGAIRKYGQENFVFEMLFDFQGDEELAKVYEWEMISKWKPEYNISYGGDGGTLPEETRKKIGDANRGRKMPPSHREKRVVFLTGRKHTEEAKAKIRAANIGRPSPNKGVSPSEETRQKISQANKGKIPWITGKKHSEETKIKIRAQRWNHSPESLKKIVAARRQAWAVRSDAMQNAAQAMQKKGVATRKLAVRCIEDGLAFEGCSDADRHYGFHLGLVSRILKGTVKNTTGKRFAYLPKDAK